MGDSLKHLHCHYVGSTRIFSFHSGTLLQNMKFGIKMTPKGTMVHVDVM